MPATPADKEDVPVTFAPGRARLATSPAPTGSETAAITIGIVPGGVLRGQRRLRNRCNNDVYLEPDQLSRKVGEPFEFPLRPAVLDGDVLSFHVAELAEPFPESLELAIGLPNGRAGAEKSYPADLHRRLRPARERDGRDCHSCCEELPPVHP